MTLKEALSVHAVLLALQEGKISMANQFVAYRWDKNDKKVWIAAVNTDSMNELHFRLFAPTVYRHIRLDQDYPDLREHLNATDWEAGQ